MQLPDCELMSTGSAEQEKELTACFKLSMCSSYWLKSRPYFVILGQQGTPYLQTGSSNGRKLAPSPAGGSRGAGRGTGSSQRMLNTKALQETLLFNTSNPAWKKTPLPGTALEAGSDHLLPFPKLQPGLLCIFLSVSCRTSQVINT